MKPKAILALIFFSIIKCSYGQIEDFQKYYQIDTLIKKCKVKKSTDFPDAVPEHVSVTEYDKLGRKTSWYYLKDSFRTHYLYSTIKDTLIKYHYCSIKGKKQEYYKIEKFVYNNQSKIAYYLSLHKNYDKDNNTTKVEIDRFYYVDSFLVKSEHLYKKRYPAMFSTTLFPTDTFLNLINKYEYINNLKGQIISRIEKNAKPEFAGIDSFYYDNKNRLIKSTNFRKNGYVGNIRAYNIRMTNEYIYSEKTITEINSKESEIGSQYENKFLRSLDKCGLEIKHFGFYFGKQELISQTKYEYY